MPTMPFPPQTPEPFTREAVERVRPGSAGVFGLMRDGAWIYVGKGDIRQRLIDLLGGSNECVRLHQPTHFVSAVTQRADEMEHALLAELKPLCNERVA